MNKVLLWAIIVMILFFTQHCAWLKSITHKKPRVDSTQSVAKKSVIQITPCIVYTAKVHSHILCKSEVKYAQTYDDLNPMDKFMMNEGFNKNDMQGKIEIDFLLQNPNSISAKIEYLKWQAVFENQLLDSGTIMLKKQMSSQENYWTRVALQYNAMKITQKNTMLAKTNTALQFNNLTSLQFFTQLNAYPVYDTTTTVVQGACKDSIMKLLILK